MDTIWTAAQFVASCLALGLGIFILGGTARELISERVPVVTGSRGATAFAGMALVIAGGYAAIMAVPW